MLASSAVEYEEIKCCRVQVKAGIIKWRSQHTKLSSGPPNGLNRFSSSMGDDHAKAQHDRSWWTSRLERLVMGFAVHGPASRYILTGRTHISTAKY